ncbi:lipid-A-disaccharide synthase [Motiliproteus sp. MSK22-1]|uniref:lipid-A-disaccharide synthase n=1 Tax=Motiliproteus sp. MSK22-1 TaxID=1897630 RepID=UPI003515F482
MRPIRIAIVAGEASGDILGAGLIRALKEQLSSVAIDKTAVALNSEIETSGHNPDGRQGSDTIVAGTVKIQLEGIAGPLMMAEGMESLFSMDRLSVMGLVEVLGRLRELLSIRKQLRQRWLENPPDLFIGIDAPDFNLPLEAKLRNAGIPTVHYVSPSVWAWREKRVLKIARSTDLMLCLLPFEKRFYDKHGVDARFVGHTLADELPVEVDTPAARKALALDDKQTWVALLPGSRAGEVEKLTPLFLDAARWLLKQKPTLKFILPAANRARFEQLRELLSGQDLPVQLIEGRSREVMQASDAVLMASGTAALEGMLLKKPLVVAYRMAPLTFAIISRMLKVPYVSLPNLLADEPLVPELLQNDATAESLGRALLKQLDDKEHRDYLLQRFTQLHEQMRLNASQQAAKAVLELITSKSNSC